MSRSRFDPSSTAILGEFEVLMLCVNCINEVCLGQIKSTCGYGNPTLHKVFRHVTRNTHIFYLV